MGLLTDVIIFPRDQNTDGLLLGVGGDGRGWEGCTKADAVTITITKSWPTVGSLGLGVRGVCSRGCRHKQVQYIQFHGEGVVMSVAVDTYVLWKIEDMRTQATLMSLNLCTKQRQRYSGLP